MSAGWQRVKAAALRAAQPINAHCELTYACSLRCAFCYNPRHHDRAGLSTGEWLAVVEELREVGALIVTLTGGDPMAHPGFLAIARRVRERALALRVLTNGRLVTPEAAEAIAALEPLSVELSLHGSRAGTHDRATGVPGSFDSLCAAIAVLKASGVRIALKTPLTRLNQDELEEMVAFGERGGGTHVIDPMLTPRDDGSRAPLSWSPSPAAVEQLYQLLAARGRLPERSRDRGGVNCGVGRITLTIDPEGRVYPCVQWRHSALGSVRERPLGAIWRDSLERMNVASVARTANDLLVDECGALASFPYCPALAAKHTGDPLVADASQRQLAEMADAVRKQR